MDIPPGTTSGPDRTSLPQEGSTGDRLDAVLVQRWVHELDRRLRASEVRLTELDAAIGDADHGANMTRGARAAAARLADEPGSSAAQLVAAVGHTFSRSVGGASGPLYGTWFSALGRTLPGDHDADATELAAALVAALGAVQHLGAAERGDKTMVDALAPAADRALAAARAGADLAGTLRMAVGAAEDGALATVPLRARRGRASYLGARSEGHQDPGATSAAIVLDALRQAAGA